MDKEQKQKEVKKNNKEEKEDTRIKEVNVDYKDTALRALADLDNYKKGLMKRGLKICYTEYNYVCLYIINP